MLKSIQFDREFCISAIEIENVSGNRMLSAKFEASKSTAAERPPQFFFVLGLITAEIACELAVTHFERMTIGRILFKVFL